MEHTESQRAAARDELEKSKLEYFCIECGRPRKIKFCPWNSKHPEAKFKHMVALRKSIPLTSQIILFLSNRNGVSTKHVFKEG